MSEIFDPRDIEGYFKAIKERDLGRVEGYLKAYREHFLEGEAPDPNEWTSPNCIEPLELLDSPIFVPDYAGGFTGLHLVFCPEYYAVNNLPIRYGTPEDDVKLLDLLLDYGADQSIPDEHGGHFPIDFATDKKKDPALFNRLLEDALQHKKKDEILDCALFSAVFMDDAEKIPALIEAGAKPTRNILDLAFRNGDRKISSETLEALEKGGADFHQIDPETQETFLHEAAATLDPVRVGFLIERGLDPNARAIGGYTPLHVVANGAGINLFNKKIGTYRRIDGELKEKIIRQLLAAGADKNAKNDEGKYPVDFITPDEPGYKACCDLIKVSLFQRVLDAARNLTGQNSSSSLLKNSEKPNETPACAGVTEEFERGPSTKKTVMLAQAGIPFYCFRSSSPSVPEKNLAKAHPKTLDS